MATLDFTPKLQRSFKDFNRLGTVLLADVEISQLEMSRVVRPEPFLYSPADLKEATFWIKPHIRALLGLVDGLSFAMRQLVVDNADDCGVQLTNKVRALLKERRYDSKTDSILPDRKDLSPAESLKLACRHFPHLFGSGFALDTGGQDWLAVRRLIDVRNCFTHPEVLEHLAVHPALPALAPATAWLTSQVTTLLAEVSERLGGSPKPIPEESPVPPYREAESPWRTFFSAEDYLRIAEYGGRTLEYFKTMFFLMLDETSLAFSRCRGGFARPGLLETPNVQFAFRTLARTLFSNVEGQISAVQFFLKAGEKRGKVQLAEDDRKALKEGDVEDRFVAAANLWSREFGFGKAIKGSGAAWKHFRGAKFFRDRITHPRGLDSIQVDERVAQTLINGFGYFLDASDLLSLDPDIWAIKADGLETAISEAEALPAIQENEADEE